MAVQFSSEAFGVLASGEIPGFTFVDIFLDGPAFAGSPSSYFADLHLCNWLRQTVNTVNGFTYEPELLAGVSLPPVTGNVTQEIQRITISQALGAFEDPAEFIIRLGNKFHGAPVYVYNFIEVDDALLFDEPVHYSEGIIKSVSRSLSSQDVVVEVTNSYGKLDMVKSLRTNKGSIQKFNKGDTSFDKASIDINQRTLDWGVK